jgi:penicillin-binding protein 1A
MPPQLPRRTAFSGQLRPFLKRVLLFLLVGAAAGVSLGLYLTRSIPEVDSLQFTQPLLTSRIFSKDGEVLQEYGSEKRVLVHHGDISPNFFRALVAVEDASFYKHHGISPRGILRALVKDVFHLRLGQGGSTITQQLARRYFLNDEKTVIRKLREMILAVNIERNYSKEQILEMYANKVYFGHGRYGVESASRYFFAKPSRDLSPTEGALLAGVIQRPMYYSPRNHPEKATKRRNLVLWRMWKTGLVDGGRYKALCAEPLGLCKPPLEEEGVAAYLAERIRMYCEQKYGEEALYGQGLQIHTTVDSRLQALAVVALRDGLHEYNRRRGYIGPRRGAGSPPEDSSGPLQQGDRRWATVHTVRDDGITVGMANLTFDLESKTWAWAKGLNPTKVFRGGDRVLLFVREGGEAPVLELDQEPVAQAALLAMDPHTGEVKALVGGYDFATSMFNRVFQAKRQTGSAVKPLIYATALAQGVTLADVVVDEPLILLTGRERAATMCSEGYIPGDFDPEYLGLITYRKALEHSVNIPAVHLLNQIGYEPVMDLARKLHISAKLKPYPSMALGSFETTLWELTAAYAALDNGGVWTEPRFINRIADREGKTLEEFRSATAPVLDPAAAYVMVQGMTGVIQRGTAGSAANMKGHFAGKTGTTNDFTDSWFVGFNPALLCGVWAGRDDNKTLGRGETGARVALPIWRRFMEPACQGQESLDFQIPQGVTKVLIDPRTGLRAGMDSPCTEMTEEVFVEGTEPKLFCNEGAHLRARLPYYLQAYAVKPDGTLVVPADDIQSLLQARPTALAWSEAEKKLGVSLGNATLTVRVEVAPARDTHVPEAVMPDLPPEGSLRCGARVEYIHEKR